MREMKEVIGVTKYLTKRCFDKILIYIDMDSPIQDEVFNLMLHQIEFMKNVYGEELVNSAGVYVQSRRNIPKTKEEAMKKILREVLHDNVPVSNN